ncbi:FecR family protein [Chitinophaga varians]|uniref:FecR family protein n=1 Tax=Chitinophaga varians TaxID=2202339 RepID=A0A847RMR7_9BACT|nr:FecR family protein [Chitinophaga varians]NLR64383.1 FecR family protein [Chitinophaga varians]
MKENQDLLSAVEKYLRGEASPEECALVNQWYHSFDDGQVEVTPEEGFSKEEIFSRMDAKLAALMQPAPTRGKILPLWLKRTAVAAGIALVLGAGLWSLSGRKNTRLAAGGAATKTSAPVLPGSNKAILLLDDGSAITLNDSTRQTVGAARVQGEALVYDQAGNQEDMKYNTLKTPQGGQFAVVLPDGSKVWLNAASSLKYPVSFNSRHRTVELTGEAYFDITPDKNKPFTVRVNNMEVQVLGTSFNVTAYPEEKNIKTTLITGAVNVNAGNSTKHLLPGQQAVWDDARQFAITNADINSVLAWKNGKFEFAGEEVGVALRQLARWYDLELQFEAGVPDEHLTASFPRNTSLDNIIRMLELSGVHCKLDNRRLTVHHQ